MTQVPAGTAHQVSTQVTGLCLHPRWHSPHSPREDEEGQGNRRGCGVVPLPLGGEVGAAGVRTLRFIHSLPPAPQDASDNHHQLLPREASRERGGPVEGPAGEPCLYQSRRAQRYVPGASSSPRGPHPVKLCSRSLRQQTVCVPWVRCWGSSGDPNQYCLFRSKTWGLMEENGSHHTNYCLRLVLGRTET